MNDKELRRTYQRPGRIFRGKLKHLMLVVMILQSLAALLCRQRAAVHASLQLLGVACACSGSHDSAQSKAKASMLACDVLEVTYA